jgi:hypothetical protein
LRQLAKELRRLIEEAQETVLAVERGTESEPPLAPAVEGACDN